MDEAVPPRQIRNPQRDRDAKGPSMYEMGTGVVARASGDAENAPTKTKKTFIAKKKKYSRKRDALEIVSMENVIEPDTAPSISTGSKGPSPEGMN
jgi:hypothetical protein